MNNLTEFGSTREDGFWPSENFSRKGFTHIETNNEPYYQVQYSREKLTLRSYCEGDTTTIVAPDLATLEKEIESVKIWISSN